MSEHDSDTIRTAVRERYAAIAEAGSSGCCAPARPVGGAGPAAEAGGCCGPTQPDPGRSARMGYTADDLAAVPEGANLGLGCGNPRAFAAMRPGETVVDLGSGAGFDAFLAAEAVGPEGRVIGVDMTPAMIEKARANARRAGRPQVEFRLGEIEALPVADASADVIISNCVINLSPDKARVFAEAFRVLKPGGRLAVSDVVATAELPPEVRTDLGLRSCCVGGAATIPELEALLAGAGFADVRIAPKDESRAFIREWAPGARAEDYVVSATIEAVKPRA